MLLNNLYLIKSLGKVVLDSLYAVRGAHLQMSSLVNILLMVLFNLNFELFNFDCIL